MIGDSLQELLTGTHQFIENVNEEMVAKGAPGRAEEGWAGVEDEGIYGLDRCSDCVQRGGCRGRSTKKTEKKKKRAEKLSKGGAEAEQRSSRTGKKTCPDETRQQKAILGVDVE